MIQKSLSLNASAAVQLWTVHATQTFFAVWCRMAWYAISAYALAHVGARPHPCARHCLDRQAKTLIGRARGEGASAKDFPHSFRHLYCAR